MFDNLTVVGMKFIIIPVVCIGIKGCNTDSRCYPNLQVGSVYFYRAGLFYFSHTLDMNLPKVQYCPLRNVAQRENIDYDVCIKIEAH